MKKRNLFNLLIITSAFLGFAACSNVDDDLDTDKDKDKEITTLYSENFGNAVSAAPWPSVVDYTGFQKEGIGADSVTYTSEGGTVSVRSNQASSGYTGASGVCNAMAAATGAALVINDIAVCGAKNIELSFGSNVEDATLTVSYKINGTQDWINIPYAKTTTTWGLVDKLAITLPDGANTIKLKFAAGATEFGTRIDDVKLTTIDVTSDPVYDADGSDVTTGNGTEANPFDVTTAIANQGGNKWVEGYIVGNVDGAGLNITTDSKFVGPFTIQTNLLIAATPTETDYSKCMPVQLPSGVIRTGLNLVTNPLNLGKKVKLYGALETYFSAPGIRTVSYYELEGGATGGTKPVDTSGALLNESLLTQTSFNKFTAYSVVGDQVWTLSTQYGAVMTGFANNVSYANEDWLISPALDLTGKTSATLTFEHARGPAGSINVGIAEGYYTVWVTNDYTEGAPSTATWTQLTGIVHGTTAWSYVSSGNLTFPTANLKANARFAFKYLSIDGASATWEVKNVLVK